MPFLNNLHQWAQSRPTQLAVAVGEDAVSFLELRDRAAAILAGEGAARLPVTALGLPNGTELAARICAAVAGTGVVAVLDPDWPRPLADGIRANINRYADAPSAARASEADGLFDGPAESPFLLGLTSGTSSVPKAFTRSRRSWQESFVLSADYFGLQPDDVTLAPGPLSSSLNLYTLGECLYAGTTFRTLAGFTPDAALASVKNDGVTRLVLVPTMLALIAARGLATGQDGGAVRTIICAGSQLDRSTVEAARRWAPDAVIHQYYGASELGFIAASVAAVPGAGLGDGRQDPVPSVGAAFPGTEISIRDGAGERARPGRPGSIYVRSSLVSDGYVWGDDGLAFSRLVAGHESAPNGTWFTVHDQGFLDAENRLHVLGRASDMVVTGGHNVYPQEVEEALHAGLSGCDVQPGNADGPSGVAVVVAGVADPVRGQRIIAAIHPGPADALSACRAAASRLPAHQRPTAYYLLGELPLTGAGKISRRILAGWIENGDQRAQRIT